MNYPDHPMEYKEPVDVESLPHQYTLDRLIYATGKAKKDEPITTATLMKCIERLKSPTHYIDENGEKFAVQYIEEEMERIFELTGGEESEANFDAIIELEPVTFRAQLNDLEDVEVTQL